jgi:methylenetetrahydrofolate dehydrogenase (NADP+)/methenyltetrahydrofolate cyclohydrolase
METQKLDGLKLAQLLKTELRARVETLHARGIIPALGTILVGQDAGSQKYVAGKHADCAEVGIESIHLELPETASEAEVLAAVQQLNQDPRCTGYIVQLPLPPQVDQNRVLQAIDPTKDADGLHPLNLGYLAASLRGEIRTPLPCTPRGILRLLEHYEIELAGRDVLILGRGLTVGRPLSLLLSRQYPNCTVTVAHSGTRNLADKIAAAEIVIAALGQAHFLKREQIAEGAVLIDVGVSRVFDEEEQRYRVLGDIDPAVAGKARALSPNPGGIGPMTRCLLLENVVEIAEAS